MSGFIVGQRCISEPEPELGLGIVTTVEHYRIGVEFPAAEEQRIYANDTPVLKRALFRVGDTIKTRNDEQFQVEELDEEDGLVVYRGNGCVAREDELSDASAFSKPQERLLAGQADPGEVFELRYETLRALHRLRKSELRGFLGGRVDLIPHQFYILHEVSHRQLPRVLLSDEVGLGKTIEACLILQRLRAIGRAERVLILVPESLVHQWFVELLRRFNLWFSIFDEERCLALERGNPDGNPFLDEQLALCSISFLAERENRREQAIEAGWEMVIVDEAHHLEWTPESPSTEYEIVEKLGKNSPGLLLLTATPTQLGLTGHFARLRLLDPDRYGDLEAFRSEAEDFGVVAQIAGKIIDDEKLSDGDTRKLKKIFNKDLVGLEKRLEALKFDKRGAKQSLLKALLDEHGTGRVVFRNSRANMSGFPKRRYLAVPLDSGGNNKTLLSKLAKELEAEANNAEESIRYQFKGDPRLDWLVSFLKARKRTKALLICKSVRKAKAIESALLEAINVKMALFHEELPLIQRDRNAAWFAEEDGAQLLICSEIGSEGRNFQFAHHLILFDIPLNPGLLEQRIGRLDRIGQTDTIQIHAPYVVGSCQEFIAEWYHQGLDAFEECAHGGNEYRDTFGGRLLELALAYGRSNHPSHRDALEAFIEETSKFKSKLKEKLRLGRDRLLELNSFDREIAADVISKIEKADGDSSLKDFLLSLLDHFGVRIEEHEGGEFVLDPSHAFIESFPSIPADGMLATFDRKKAIAREDIAYLSPDHPLIFDVFDLLINSDRGSCSFSIRESDEPNLLVEAIFVLEPVALSRLHIDRFLSPTPLRILVDVHGRDLSRERDFLWTRTQLGDGSINRFLERPGFSAPMLNAMLEGAQEIAEDMAKRIRIDAKNGMKATLSEEVQRLVDLRKINSNVRPEEIEMAKAEIKGLHEVIDDSRLRLDSLRLIVEGPVNGLEANIRV